MPRLKGAAAYFKPDALEAFSEAGHGIRLLIGDESLRTPLHAEAKVGTRCHTSAEVLFWLAKLSFLDENDSGEVPVTVMAPDPDKTDSLSTLPIQRFRAVTYSPILDENGQLVRLNLSEVPRLREDTEDGWGFYRQMDDPRHRLIVVESNSQDPFDCALVTVGHSQRGSLGLSEYDTRVSHL
jgi:hypothetical protein